MDNVLQLNEFFVEGGKQGLSHVLLHITEPSTAEEMAKGYFFAICEINNAETKYITKLQEIIDEAENNYYETPDEAGKTSLEIILEKINQHAYILTRPDISLHCIIGAIRQPEIIFTFFGRPQMILFYKNRQGLYQKMDLINNGSEEPSAKEPTQLFSSIVQGKLTQNDYLFAGTPHITNYFSLDRLEKIVTGKPAADGAQHIQRVLAELKGDYSFGGLIMQIRQPGEADGRGKKTPLANHGVSAKSLRNLFSTEKDTANTLSASLIPRLNDKFRSLFEQRAYPSKITPLDEAKIDEAKKDGALPAAQINSLHVYAHRAKPTPPPYLAAEKIQAFIRLILRLTKTLARGLWWVIIFLAALIQNIFRGVVMLFFIITDYQHRRKIILEDWRRQRRAYRENIKRLPAATKALLAASIIIAMFFAGSVLYLRGREMASAAARVFNDAVQVIKEKKDAMESALIYKNELAALNDLLAAKNILANLRCVTKEQKNICGALTENLNALTIQIRKVTTITPELLIDWGGTFALAQENLIKINSKLIAFSSATSTLLTYDLLTKISKVVPTTARIKGFNDAAVPKENDYALLLFNNRELLSLNPGDNSVKNIEVSYPNENVNIQSLLVYNRRLYSLDALNNKIYKHDTIKTGFERGREWAQNSGSALDGAGDITIDGDIFVLTKTGGVAKFSAGALQPFSIQGVDPALDGGGKIWTYTDLDYIYVLDGKNKRLLILEKDGRLKRQLTANEFKNPSGLAIDTATNNAYILDDNRLFKINLK